MATLCLACFSCQDEFEVLSSVNDNSSLVTRSNSNIQVSFSNANCADTTITCDHVEINYLNKSKAELIFFSDYTTFITTGSVISIIPEKDLVLDITAESFAWSCGELELSLCDSVLCYNCKNPSLSGSSTSFIVEDTIEGF